MSHEYVTLLPIAAGVIAEQQGLWARLRTKVADQIIVTVASAIAAGVIAALVAFWALMSNLPGLVGLLPKTAVVAFNQPTCPPGWEDYRPAWGRVLVGAFAESDVPPLPGNRDARQVDIKPKPFGVPGGEEEHKLTVDELPAHNHANGAYSGLMMSDGNETNIKGDGPNAGQPNLNSQKPLLTVGQNLPHNNLPPYLALRYCQKT